MTARKVNPPQQTAPMKLLSDAELGSYFQQLDYFLYQMWQRTGGGDDFIADSSNSIVSLVSISAADSPYTVVNDYERVFVNASSGAVTVVLKGASINRYVDVVKVDSSANVVTLSSTDLINGEPSQTLLYQYESAECASSESEWVVI